MSVDEFKLVIASDTGWSWDLGAIVAAAVATWPEAEAYQGETAFPVQMALPDERAGRRMQVAIHESGRLVSLEYGSPEGSAEFVEWVVSTFPPPDDVEVLLYEWGANPRVTARTTAQDLLAAGP